MTPRADFVRKWRIYLAGLALCGTAADRKEGPMDKAMRVFDIPGEMEALAGKMWDDAQPKEVMKPVPANGVKRT